jgi:hypothetical protein
MLALIILILALLALIILVVIGGSGTRISWRNWQRQDRGRHVSTFLSEFAGEMAVMIYHFGIIHHRVSLLLVR